MKDFQQVEFSCKQYAGDCVFPVLVGAMVFHPASLGPKAGTKLRKDNASQYLTNFLQHTEKRCSPGGAHCRRMTDAGTQPMQLLVLSRRQAQKGNHQTNPKYFAVLLKIF
jgi:hypothetical protein